MSLAETASPIPVAQSREAAFEQLVERVQACRDCPRMDGRLRVLSRSNGSVHAALLFVAEAPGRLGGDRWGIPLYGDRTGRNFEALLREAGPDRASIFITNAVLCYYSVRPISGAT